MEEEYGLELVTAPTGVAIPALEAKLHARIDLNDEDVLVNRWIAAALRYAETHTERKWLAQTWKMTLNDFPCDVIKLPWEPVSSVTSVKYYDTAGTLQTLVANTDYQVWLAHSPPLIAPAPSTVWPPVQCDKLGAVEVVFVVGYANADLLPPELVQAVFLTLTYWSENRGDGRDPTMDGLPPGAKRLLNSLWTGTY